MSTKLYNWLTLEIFHQYFENNICAIFSITPFGSMLKVLKNYKIHLQRINNIYKMHIEVRPSKELWTEFHGIDDMYFQLINSDTNFNNYTDLISPIKENHLLYLTNTNIETSSSTKENLISSTYIPIQGLRFQLEVQSATSISIKNSMGKKIFDITTINQHTINIDISVFGTGVYELWIDNKLHKLFFGTDEHIDPHCYGIVHLQMKPIIISLKENKIPAFNINFNARATYWQYAIVVPKDKKITVQELTIEGIDGKTFPQQKETIKIGNEESMLFTSPDTIKFCKRAKEHPRLKLHYKNNFSDTPLELDMKMPIPSPTSIYSKTVNNQRKEFSQSIIYV